MYKIKLLLALLLSVGLWNVLLFIHSRNSALFSLQLLLSLIFVLIIPGALGVIALGAKKISLHTFLNVVGLSLLFNILVGLTANYVPLAFGVNPPLSLTSVIVAYDLLLTALMLVSLPKLSKLHLRPERTLKFNWYSAMIVAVAFLGLSACILGTFRLNNGGGNQIMIAGLIALIMNLGLTLLFRKRVGTLTYLVSLASFTWGLLLITSLRSNYVSGQDIKQEFRVYTITTEHSFWSIANLKDAYNACLSITLLPYVFVKLLGVSAAVVFKAFFQLLFVICPLAIFSMLQSRFGKNVAFLGAIFFLSLPTVGIDLPLQARQQVAFLFFSLFTLNWFSHKEAWLKSKWQLFVLFFAVGVIVSHYSTAYILIAILLLYMILRTILTLVSSLRNRESPTFSMPSVLALVIILGGFFWLSQVTSVSTGLADKVGESITSLYTKKTDPVYGDTNGSLGGYITTTTANDTTFADANNGLIFVDDNLKPAGILSNIPESVVNFASSLNKKIYYTIGVLILELMIIVGLCYMLLSRKKALKKDTDTLEIVVLSVAVLMILLSQILLPGLTQNYGITRAFIQAFIILSIPFVYGMTWSLKRIAGRYSLHLMAIIALAFAFVYSGLSGQFLGGVRPALSYNNAGPYYGAFYVRKNNILAYDWIQKNVPGNGNVNGPDYSLPTALAYDPSYSHYGGGILPFQVESDHYVVLTYSQITNETSYIAGPISAVKFDENRFNQRNTIYSTDQSKLYK